MSKDEIISALLYRRPYFGSYLRAFQGSATRHAYMGALAQFLANHKGRQYCSVLEVGSWAGSSAITWANAVRVHFGGGRVLCVDPWQVYKEIEGNDGLHYREMREAALSGLAYQLFLHNVEYSGVADVIEHRVGVSEEILPTLPSASFDLVFIDASHIYTSVSHDIKEGLRLAADGGIVCGDDLELQLGEVDPEHHRAALRQDTAAVLDPRGGGIYHPGVTQAVHDVLGHVQSWEGLWAVLKQGQRFGKIDLEGCTVQVPKHVQSDERERQAVIRIVEDAGAFNIIESLNGYMAVSKHLGDTQLFVETLGERELPPYIFIDKDLKRVQERALGWSPAVALVAESPNYRFFQIGSRHLALIKSAGDVHFFKDRVGEKELYPAVILGDSLDELVKRVDDL